MDQAGEALAIARKLDDRALLARVLVDRHGDGTTLTRV
jgi:hypothetical protein